MEPGITGWIKAKINGTRQLVDVVLGTFPTPIPPPNHADLPSTSDTCLKCHDVQRGGALSALKNADPVHGGRGQHAPVRRRCWSGPAVATRST